jgi:hypothetical protein
LANAEGRDTGAGAAGAVIVDAPTITLTEGAQIASGTLGPGQGGTVTVRATEAVMVEGAASGIFSSASSSGNAGQVLLSTPILHLQQGAVIDSSTATEGQGGDIAVHAQHLELSDGGTIATRSAGTGNAGNIVLQAGEVFRSRHGAVTTEAEQADGGNIQLTAGSQVALRDSQITATVKSGVGQGGNITIDPQFVVLQRSQVRADAFGGPGGNVRLVAEVFLADPASQVSASSALNLPGTVAIEAAVTNPSAIVAPLPPDFARAPELLRDRCAARLRAGTVSSLVVRGRASLPASYDGPLPSRLYEPQRQPGTPTGAGHVLHETAVTPQDSPRAAHALAPLVLELSCAR